MPKKFSLYWYIFYQSVFLRNLRLPWKQSLPWINCIEYTFFYHSGFLSNLRLPWKQCLPWHFSRQGGRPPRPPPRTPMTPLDQVIKKSCDTFQEKWKQAGWAPQIHNQYLQSQVLVSPWSHFSIHCSLYYYEAPEEAQNQSQCSWSGDGSASIQAGHKTQKRISLSPI